MELPGIYIHLPFCSVRCSYCDFPLTTRWSLRDRYLAALLKEIEMRPPPPIADTFYFGGGTPSLIPSAWLEKLLQKFSLLPGSEVTLEANPEHVTTETLSDWKKIGINRLSIGVQSLEEPALRWMLRTHTALQAMNAVKAAIASPVYQINVDLMIGTPGQTAAGFLKGLHELMAIRPHHFSIYMLEIHQGTALKIQMDQGRVTPMKEEQQVECYEFAVQTLKSAGYEHYEVSNFALPGYRSRHNSKYWEDVPYYGYGPGACSYMDSLRLENVRSIPEYIRRLERAESPVESRIEESEEVRMRNYMIFGLRKIEGISIKKFEQRFGRNPLFLFPDHGKDAVEQGLLEVSGDSLRLTLRGILLSNDVLSSVI